MYKIPKFAKTSISVNQSYEGERIEKKIERMMNNNEPITDPGAQTIYTDRKDGVQPDYDIRADKWEYAVEAMDKVSKSHIAKREERHKPKTETDTKGEKITQNTSQGSGSEPIVAPKP